MVKICQRTKNDFDQVDKLNVVTRTQKSSYHKKVTKNLFKDSSVLDLVKSP